MPSYEYTCLDCGTDTTVRATIAEKSAGLFPRCAACGGERLRRSFATLALVGTRREPAGCCGGGGGCGCG